MKNYFIIHGSYGSSKENWFFWLENELKLRGEVFNFDYPTPRNQNFESWAKVLDSVKDKINENSVFICHSIACVFLIKYCIRRRKKIGKAIFVSGFNNYYFDKKFDKINERMYVKEISKFKNYCSDITCIYSLNDPFINFETLKNFADELESVKVVYEFAGHFNESAGYTSFEDILKYIE